MCSILVTIHPQPYETSLEIPCWLPKWQDEMGVRFGDIGGGVVLNAEWGWIPSVTGLHVIPEPAAVPLVGWGWISLLPKPPRGARRREGRGGGAPHTGGPYVCFWIFRNGGASS